jgi:hypothetical protein
MIGLMITSKEIARNWNPVNTLVLVGKKLIPSMYRLAGVERLLLGLMFWLTFGET